MNVLREGSTESDPARAEKLEPRRPRLRRVAMGVSAVFAGALALLGWATKPRNDLPRAHLDGALTVTTVEAKAGSGYTVRRSFVGRIEAARQSQVGFELDGRVAEIGVEEGDEVDGGQWLARLDTARLEARRAELVAALDQARASLELARLTRDRVGEALALNAVSIQEWDEAEQTWEVRRAAVERAASALGRLDVDLAKSEVFAPFDALIAERQIDEGEVIAAGRPILTLLERVHPEARISVAGNALKSLEAGLKSKVVVNARVIPGTIKALLPVRGRETRSVDVILSLDADLEGLRVGDLATLELEQEIAEKGFWLPITALTESSRGLWAAYVARPIARDGGRRGGRAHRLDRRQVEIIHQESDRAFVRGTLSPGEKVVGEGLHRLVPGQLVLVDDEERS